MRTRSHRVNRLILLLGIFDEHARVVTRKELNTLVPARSTGKMLSTDLSSLLRLRLIDFHRRYHNTSYRLLPEGHTVIMGGFKDGCFGMRLKKYEKEVVIISDNAKLIRKFFALTKERRKSYQT